jgi:hypothetical protein
VQCSAAKVSHILPRDKYVVHYPIYKNSNMGHKTKGSSFSSPN